MKKIFTYGTLLNKNMRFILLGKDVPVEDDVLKGYSKEPHTVFKIYPTIKQMKGSSVKGIVFNVDENDLKILDRYESDLYKKIEVNLVSGKKALVYIESTKNVEAQP